MTPTQQSAGLVERLDSEVVEITRGALQGVILLAEVAHSMTSAPDVRKLAMSKIKAARAALATTPTADEGGENV